MYITLIQMYNNNNMLNFISTTKISYFKTTTLKIFYFRNYNIPKASLVTKTKKRLKIKNKI